MVRFLEQVKRDVFEWCDSCHYASDDFVDSLRVADNGFQFGSKDAVELLHDFRDFGQIRASECHVICLLEQFFPVELPTLVAAALFDFLADLEVGL